ncbi:TRAP transporter substrate-binding protein [uncultured Roseovarius sp.]|uniref:TRAP transporter substrate-binding protein n=1 Tax=uncultured Roseovarius sp. TaxID=293344 RepID=UPI0025FCBE17|nr:TRAP transporter substrate-binding protein [uncultured Roseovarius sp.]
MSFFAKATFVVGASLVASSLSAQDLTVRLGHVTQTSHPFHIGAQMYADKVSELSQGSIKIELYPARQLGDDRQLLEGIQLGTVDMAVISSAIFGGATPLMDSLQLPFLITDYAQLAEAFTSDEGKALLDGLSDIGVAGLGYYEGGQRHFLSKADTVTMIDDFSGLKTRVVPAKLHLDIWQAIGVSPTPVAYGEIYSSLQTGVLDATEINITSVEGEKLYEVADKLTLTGHYFWPGVLAANPGFLDRITEGQRYILIKAAEETIAPQVQAASEQDEAALTILKEQGVEIADFAELDTMRAKVKDVSASYEALDPRIKAFADAQR